MQTILVKHENARLEWKKKARKLPTTLFSFELFLFDFNDGSRVFNKHFHQHTLIFLWGFNEESLRHVVDINILNCFNCLRKFLNNLGNDCVYIWHVLACFSSYVRFNFVVVTWQTLKDVRKFNFTKEFSPIKILCIEILFCSFMLLLMIKQWIVWMRNLCQKCSILRKSCYEIFGLKLFVNSLEFIRNTLKNFIF